MVTMSLYDFLKQDVQKMILSIGPKQRGNLHPLIMKEVERNLINLVLEETKFNLFRAAKILGIGRTTLYRKIKELEIPLDSKSLDSNIFIE